MLNGSIKMAMEVEYSTRERHLAGQLFDYFCTTQSMKEILSSYTLLCDVLRLKPNRLNDFYPKLKAILSNNWKAQALFAKFDERANHKEYQKGKACSKTRVLIIGAGPAGLKMAIECQLLGAKVVLIEKRDEFSRNNVIHLWPFVIQDLNNLGAKTFYGKFCAGSINHISIRRLQFILLKMALLLGVEVHQCIAFDDLVEPEISEDDEITGWRALLQPREHPVSQYEFDVLIGADGRRNSLRGFEKNVLRTKLCIGITVNFINRNTEEEAAVNEIGGLSYIFAQQFFKDIESSTGIDLENITYYKDETHYFVMTAKKSSLIKKGVLLRDYLNVATLLSKENVSREALMNYALEAARTATKGQIPNMTFAVNHCAEPDIAIFDFSTSYSSENASIVYEVLGKRLLCQLIGDSLMEPFWPTGSGCARCFLSAMDASWAVRSWCQRPEKHPLLVIAERESIYRLLPQTTANNLQPNIPAYTLDPISRYSNLNTRCVTPNSVSKLYISDHPIPLDAEMPQRETGNVTLRAMLNWAGHPDLQSATCPKALWDIVMRYRHDLLPEYNEENYSLIYQLLEEKILPPLQLEYDLDDTPYRYLLGVYVAFKGEVAYVPSIALDQDSILALFQSMVSVPRPMPVLTNTTVAVPSINPNRRQTVDNRFLNRQHRVQHGQTEDKWTAGDTIIKRVDTKLKDTGRPEQGRTSVKSLMAKFLDRPVPPVQVLQENPGLSRGAKRDVDRNPAIVQPGNAHPTNSTEAVDSPTGQDVDSIPNPASTPMSTEVVDRSIIGLEDSPTNQDLPSISTINESNTTRCYPVYNDSDDYQMDDDMLNYLNDVFESAPINMPSTSAYDGSASSLETASNRQQTRKKRPHKKIASSSSEMESDEEDSDSSDDDEKSSGTEVSTDSEFACEDIGVNIPPPAILVTEAPPHISPPQDYPLNRTKSAGGLATKRALELKRKYLLGESSPPAVRKSESTSQLDSKLEAFRINITEFQKMLHPATPTPQTGTPILSYQFTFEEKKPPPDIPDIIKNICNHVPVDLLTKGDSILDWKKPFRNERDPDLETDSLSDESSTSDTAPNRSVPRLEVHNEGGELIQLDSLILLNNAVEDKTYSRTTEEGPASLAEVSESSESCKDATTLALTETELSDWATEIVVIDDCGLDENGLRKRNKNPRSLSGPKLIQDPKNVETISSHVCGRDGLESELVVYSNAPEYLEFADEGDQDPTIESTSTPCNEGYMELVDDEYDPYSASRDRSINFIERVCSDTTIKPDTHDTLKFASNFSESLEFIDSSESKSGSLHNTKIAPESFSFYEKMPCGLNESNDSYSSSCALKNVEDNIIIEAVNDMKVQKESITLTEMSPPLLSMTDKNGVTVSYSTKNGNSLDDVSPPLVSDSISHSRSLTKVNYETKPIPGEKFKNIRNYSPAICRSASENLGGPRTKKTTSTDSNWSIPLNYKIPRARDSPYQLQSQLTKVEELKRQREEQTEVVRRLVLQRLGGAKLGKKSTSRSRSRVLPSSMTPPPVPPPPILPAPLLPDIFPEVPPRPTSQPRLSLSMQSSLSDPELNREQRSSKGFLKSISNYFNKHLGPKHKCESEPDLTTHPARPNERANTSRHTWYQPTATTPQSTPRPTVCASKASPLRETRVISPNFPRDRSSGTRIDTVNQQVDQRDRPESDVSEMLQPASPSAAAPTTAGNIRDKVAREQRQKTIWIKKARRLERISIRENENQDHIVAQILDIRATEESRRSMEEAQRAMESMLRAKWGSVGE
ncbi:F-actin-monooxygenase Mical isoform X15 [Pieris brassicae]|uniref:F-actin-monooxygenase Mical isoform X15 n=1 Tax=Pieris brassicae TaxID=7116 RepID=UPI001E66167B|nr:F-actin-monooxygenase Mical isoform X15 [Pieris brassicae]